MFLCLANCSYPQVTRAFSSRSRPASQLALSPADHARVGLLRIPWHLVQLVEAWYRLHVPHHPHPHVVIRQGPAHRGDVLPQVLRIRRRRDCACDRWMRDHPFEEELRPGLYPQLAGEIRQWPPCHDLVQPSFLERHVDEDGRAAVRCRASGPTSSTSSDFIHFVGMARPEDFRGRASRRWRAISLPPVVSGICTARGITATIQGIDKADYRATLRQHQPGLCSRSCRHSTSPTTIPTRPSS